MIFICVYTMCQSLSATPWAVARQAPLSMKFSRQKYRSGLPFPSLEDLPHLGSNLGLPHCRWILYHLGQQGSPWAPHTHARSVYTRVHKHARLHAAVRVHCAHTHVCVHVCTHAFTPHLGVFFGGFLIQEFFNLPCCKSDPLSSEF